MALKFPNGTVFGISTATGAPIGMTGVTNDDPPSADFASTVPSGSVVVVKSGWSGIHNRVSVVEADLLTGFDTRDATNYPANGGNGTVETVTAWVDFSQEIDVSTSGGEQQYWTGQFLESRTFRQISVPTYKNAKNFTLPLYFDPSLPWYAAAKALDAKRAPVALRARLPGGDTIYYYGYFSFDADPSMSANNPMQVTATFSINSEHTYIEAV